jgi:hypothetical protein
VSFHRCLLLVTMLSLSAPAYADLVTFSSLAAFTAAAPGLPVETFESGLVDAICDSPLTSAAASACFPAGGLLPGVVYSATGDPYMVVRGPALPIGNTSKVLGPFTPGLHDSTSLSLGFTGVTAVGFDVFPGFGSGNMAIQIFSPTDASLGSYIVPVVFGANFFGVVSTGDLIGRVTIESLGPPSVELIDNLRFGAATVPEPSSLLLLAAGLSIVLRVRKRN